MSEIALEFKPVDTEPIKEVAEVVTTTLKRAYTMSDLKKEQLVRARARALELRTTLNAIKPPKEKTVKFKTPSKMEIEISEIQAAKPVAEPVPLTEPETEPVVVTEPKQKVKKLKDPPIKQQRKNPSSLLVSIPTPPPTPPPIGFRRNGFGFYLL